MNEDRFELLFRDRLLVKAVENRLDRSASEVFRAMLRLNELSSDATSEFSALLSSVEGNARGPLVRLAACLYCQYCYMDIRIKGFTG